MVNDLLWCFKFFQDKAIIVVNKPPGMPVQVGNFIYVYFFPAIS